MSTLSRRQLMQRSGAALGGILGLPLARTTTDGSPLRVVVTGGHPDDPETGCGGLIALLTQAGHTVTMVYLTRGEAGIAGAKADEAAAIRTREAQQAGRILRCDTQFVGQVDGDTYVDASAYQKMAEILNAQSPHLLLTHWPIDAHRDHRSCSALTYTAWLGMNPKPDLYFYEVMSGSQTQNFAPTNFVDITAVRATKHAACFAHRSQQIEEAYAQDHGKMEEFRGLESGYDFAEALVRHWWNPRSLTEF